MNLKPIICVCDKLLLTSWPWSLYPSDGNIQTKAKEASYEAECPAGFSFYEICLFKAHLYLQEPHPLHFLPNSNHNFPAATKTKYLWHSQRGIKSLHFQDVDFIGYSILQAPEYPVDIKSTFVSPRNRNVWNGGEALHKIQFGLLTWFMVGLSGGSLWITIW